MRRAQPWKTNRARVLRASETSAEAKLWSKLRDRRLDGLKFVRQAPIESYFVDFLCRDRKIIVEVDGGTHATDAEIVADAAREAELRRRGYRVFRATNDEIYDNIDGVLKALLSFVSEGA
jgi:very-short-patch-repair endonuclease